MSMINHKIFYAYTLPTAALYNFTETVKAGLVLCKHVPSREFRYRNGAPSDFTNEYRD